jgi:hypothetical protein
LAGRDSAAPPTRVRAIAMAAILRKCVVVMG